MSGAWNADHRRSKAQADFWNLTGLAGISGAVYTDPVAFSAGFRIAMMISAGLLVAAAAVAFTLLRHPRRECAPDRLRIQEYPHCGVTGPQIYPRIRTAER